jgi:transcriptional regulator with XRE-family HTH domain
MPENIGKRLQEARRRKEFSLRQVSEETKIGENYLEALEKEQYDVFPAKIYVVSFLRSYARYLRLDAESLVQAYKREHCGEKDRIDFNPRFPIMVSQYSGEKLMPKEGIAVFRSTRKGLIPFIVATGLIVGTGLTAIFCLRWASHQLSQQRMSKINMSTNIPRDISMAVETNGKTWLRVVGDSVVFFEGILFSGEKRTWVAKNGMNVRIGNVNGVKLYVNGEEVNTISGNIRGINELIFTKLKGKGSIKIEQKRPVITENIEPLEKGLPEKER